MSKARDIADLDFNSVDLDGGTIDGATISTSDITVTSGKTLDVSAGTLTLANNQISGDKIEGGTVAAMTITSLSGTLQTAAQPNITSLGTVDITGVVTANAGVVVDQLTIDGGNITSSSGGMRISGADDITVDAVGDVILSCDGDQVKFDDGTSTRFTFNLDSTPTMGMGTLTLFENEIDVSSGNLTLDVAGDIVLDTDGADVRFKDAGTEFYKIRNESGVVQLVSTVSDSDIHIVGKDGNSAITALSLDMSAAGAATFNSSVRATQLEAYKTNHGGDVSVAANQLGNAYENLASTASLILGATSTTLVNSSKIVSDHTAASGGGTNNHTQSLSFHPVGGNSQNFEAMKIRSNGYVDIAGASDLRLTLGSQGTAGNNDANWIRGNGTSLSYNAASANHIWETGGSEKMRIDSSGNVTIGSSSLSANAALKFQADTGTFTLEHERGSHSLTLSDSDGTGEILRIDTSGNVMVGKTSTALTSSGFASTPNDFMSYTNTSTDIGDRCLVLNRQSADGALIEFRKANGNVGTIGAKTGSLYIGTGDAGIGFNHHGGGDLDSVMPYSVTTGAFLNGAVDIGGSVNRFKDAFLSGGIHLGGTGAANKLDDYEEGTWTPAFTFDIGGTGIVYGSRSGKYTKVGNAVHVSFLIIVNSGVGSGDYWVRLTGIPFVGNGSNHFSGRVRLNNTGSANFNMSVEGGGASLLCYHANGASQYATGAYIVGQQLSGSFTYFTNS